MPSPTSFLLIQIVTFSNLAFGVLSIISSDVKLAAIFILVAAIIDRIDGKLARKFGAESDFGKQLDSFSDLISFGVAPALIAWKTGLNFIGIFGYIVVISYIMAGTLRLARFNLTSFSTSYSGLPITAAGSIAAFVTFFPINNFFLSTILIILSLLMVSKIRFKKI